MCDGRLGTDTHSRDGYKHEHVALGERTEGCGLMAATTLASSRCGVSLVAVEARYVGMLTKWSP